ncbi:tyrosine-type recombinase/integrase [Lutibacter sp.]|uniref:tyrosine-type recombinase/integrase n=1 Tax=Lutibacter sp. TaxID=1925666 RepID=UPI001A235D86|nr:tyrosine-type recombinase/integrase [Lutibacter sp.]MBI9040229.1 site-specific integrase [Lutibacter sp.]
MATFKFTLRKGKETSALIYINYSYGTENRIRYSTGLKIINSKNWSVKYQNVKNVNEEVNKTNINNQLNKTKTFLEGLYSDLTINRGLTVTNLLLTNELDIFFKKKTRQQNNIKHLEFLPFFKWYIEHYKINALPQTKKPLAKNTSKTYSNSYNIFKKFNDTVYTLKYDKLTLDFYDDFLKYLYNSNYSTNYIGTQIKILKTILNAAFEKDFHNNTDFKKRYFTKPTEEINNIYLTENELLKIYNADLTDYKTVIKNKTLKLTKTMLENARDLFLIGANTGLRISDFNNLSKNNIITANGIQYLNVTTTKTGANLTIPINPMVNAILKKRNGTPPQTMPEQHLNYAIKQIGSIAKINTIETKTVTKGGKKSTIKYFKYDLISSHTARRSFCTNAYKSGMPTIDIMAISGHKTEKVFYNYIKVNNIERAEKIRLNKFFTNNNLKLA